jgi:3'-phosphoadenosine 5'-phosphosulfate sulfotransferase (PAPS reductase)/FAD synthetase
MITVLSLGAGVQSTTMALMVKHGDLPPVDCAIFADTGWEPKHVYAHLDWLETVLPYPVHRVSAGNLRTDTLNRSKPSAGRIAAVPWFMSNGGIGRRQCTKEYKIRPLQRKVRELLGDRTPKAGSTMLNPQPAEVQAAAVHAQEPQAPR